MQIMRKDLLKWQLESYDQFHQSPKNLLIHVLTVPLFWLGLILALVAIFTGFRISMLIAAVPCLLLPLIAQGIGHKLEAKAPIPFLSVTDFASRFCAEQLVTFPKWFLTKWTKKNTLN